MIEFGMQTTIGSRHQVNEDCLGHELAQRLWLIADGMGGHAAGDIASGIVRDQVQQEVLRGADLSAAVNAAHLAVAEASKGDPKREGMGSTVVAVRLADGDAEVAWVGDSRAYLIRSGKMRILTHDHTLVQWLLDRGDITADEAIDYPNKNILVRTLGLEHPVVDEARVAIKQNDLLLLCSDGITAELTHKEICDIVLQEPTPQDAADQLIAKVIERRGKDDASAIVIRVPKQDKLRGASAVLLPAAAGIGFGILAFLIWNWMKATS
jgi:PPM family protein phosphatase